MRYCVLFLLLCCGVHLLLVVSVFVCRMLEDSRLCSFFVSQPPDHFLYRVVVCATYIFTPHRLFICWLVLLTYVFNVHPSIPYYTKRLINGPGPSLAEYDHGTGSRAPPWKGSRRRAYSTIRGYAQDLFSEHPRNEEDIYVRT